ncbi:MAG: HAD family phosphatase [Deltaproteobacteria bacterium]|nr:HAD family phosphatase [Deltaproteobacteria bacterium]MBN2670269.1 HAD family phosphatase [Deltaproteobacteria bacterium]
MTPLNTDFSAVQYILWDNDGVLVDTEQYYYEAGRMVLEAIGIALSVSQFKERSLRLGHSVFDVAREAGCSEEECATLRARRDTLYDNFLRSAALLIPGVSDVVKRCAARFRMCIVSSSMKPNFHAIHSRTGDLLSYFDFQLLNGDYPRAKPHPDPWMVAVNRFNAAPHQCLVIEDSPRGIQAAKAANIRVVAVESRFFTATDLAPYLETTDRCLSSIAALPALLGIR